MTFYYFINHILKDNSIDVFKKISFLHIYINREKTNNKFINNPILASEIINIYNKLYKIYESKYLYKSIGINFFYYQPNYDIIYYEFLYLQLVCESYFLEEHPVYLLDKLIKSPIKYKLYIIRLLNYDIFDEFITLRSYMKLDMKDFIRENKNNNYTKNTSYQIYLININSTHFKNYFTL